MKEILKIGNAQAFWGDQCEAPIILLKQQPDLDYLTLDYLSEVSLSIMAAQRTKDPIQGGYAHDFVSLVEKFVPFWRRGSKVKIVTNAGGLDPIKCASACIEILKASDSPPKRIGVVLGDDVLSRIKADAENPLFNNLENQKPLSSILKQLTTANAYLGAKPLVQALQQGADLVITGRVADPSLTVAPCVFHFDWSWEDHDRLAQATLAGHLIECGTQVTGGISTNWLEIPNQSTLGFPVIEMSETGSFIITKPKESGGCVNIETVKEQILYEIGDPDAYLSPDVTLSLLSVQLEEEGKERIRVLGAKGRNPPSTYKVSATYQDGFKAEGSLVIFGRQARRKALLCGEILLDRLRSMGSDPERFLVECLGNSHLIPGIISQEDDSLECVLRICVADHRRKVVEDFSKQIASLVTSGPQGTTGYTTGRPTIRSVFGYWPCLIPTSAVKSQVEWLEMEG